MLLTDGGCIWAVKIKHPSPHINVTSIIVVSLPDETKHYKASAEFVGQFLKFSKSWLVVSTKSRNPGEMNVGSRPKRLGLIRKQNGGRKCGYFGFQKLPKIVQNRHVSISLRLYL